MGRGLLHRRSARPTAAITLGGARGGVRCASHMRRRICRCTLTLDSKAAAKTKTKTRTKAEAEAATKAEAEA